MMYGYGILNNHVPTLKATAMRGGASSTLGAGIYAVYKGESNGNDSLGVYNAIAVSGGVTYTTGKSGNEFNFNGVNGVVTLPINSFKLTGDFSFSFWVYPVTITGTHCIFINDSYVAPNEKGYRILQRDSRLELKIFNNTTTVTLITGSVFSANTRYFCTVSHSSTGNEITVNGVSQVTDTNSTNAIFDVGSIPYIGVNQGINVSPNSWFEGRIDELNIWSKKLTSTEVTELYNTGTGKFYPY